jgi:hypothetical protein
MVEVTLLPNTPRSSRLVCVCCRRWQNLPSYPFQLTAEGVQQAQARLADVQASFPSSMRGHNIKFPFTKPEPMKSHDWMVLAGPIGAFQGCLSNGGLQTSFM